MAKKYLAAWMVMGCNLWGAAFADEPIIGGADGPTGIFLSSPNPLVRMLYVLIPLGIIGFALYWRFFTQNRYEQKKEKKDRLFPEHKNNDEGKVDGESKDE